MGDVPKDYQIDIPAIADLPKDCRIYKPAVGENEHYDTPARFEAFLNDGSVTPAAFNFFGDWIWFKPGTTLEAINKTKSAVSETQDLVFEQQVKCYIKTGSV